MTDPTGLFNRIRTIKTTKRGGPQKETNPTGLLHRIIDFESLDQRYLVYPSIHRILHRHTVMRSGIPSGKPLPSGILSRVSTINEALNPRFKAPNVQPSEAGEQGLRIEPSDLRDARGWPLSAKLRRHC